MTRAARWVARAGVTLVAVAWLAAAGRAQPPAVVADAPRPIADLALVRCVTDRPLPCVRVRLDEMPPGAAVRAAAASTAEVARWGARLGPYTLQPVAVRPVRGGAPRAVLTLVDVSGSMGTNGGMQVARSAVRSFVRELGAGLAPEDSTLVRAGVAGFASRGVVAGVQGAAFSAPAAAAGAVDRLPAPAGNTGLYAAVLAGAERVAAEVRALGPGARGALVVVTDGRNDVLDPAGRVRQGDDPGLATGPAGRAAAADAARRLGVPLFLVGVGNDPDMQELGALAGREGQAYRTAINAVALREVLIGVDEALTPGREVLFVAQGVERASLARPGWPVNVVRAAAAESGDAAGAGARAAHWEGRWPSPLLTAPGFAGAAYGDGGVRPADGGAALTAAPPWLRDAAADAPELGRRGAVALFLAALAGAAWWLPRALWRPAALPAGRATVGEPTPGVAYGAVGPGGVLRTMPLQAAGRAAAAPTASAAPAPVGAGAPGTVRADVQEGPPRRPADVTAGGARRRVGPPPAARPAGGQTFAVHRPDVPPPDPGPGLAGPA